MARVMRGKHPELSRTSNGEKVGQSGILAKSEERRY
jgi:hypothetical protein